MVEGSDGFCRKFFFYFRRGDEMMTRHPMLYVLGLYFICPGCEHEGMVWKRVSLKINKWHEYACPKCDGRYDTDIHNF
jgi:transcription elongation factor Elf1